MVQKSNSLLTGNFAGFSKDGLEFLTKLKRNNKREWFQARKPFFEEHLQKPLTELLIALERELSAKKLPLKGTPFRIYRDVRFSADKTPYNTHISAALHRNGKKALPGVVYVHIGESERYMAAGFWQPERPMLNNWRLKIREEPNSFLHVVKQLQRSKLELSNEHALKRMPRGFEAMEDGPLAGFLRMQSFVVTQPLAAEEVRSQSLPKTIARFAANAKPLLDFGWSLPESKPHMIELL